MFPKSLGHTNFSEFLRRCVVQGRAANYHLRVFAHAFWPTGLVTKVHPCEQSILKSQALQDFSDGFAGRTPSRRLVAASLTFFLTIAIKSSSTERGFRFCS